jgi:hypothetical protein
MVIRLRLLMQGGIRASRTIAAFTRDRRPGTHLSNHDTRSRPAARPPRLPSN